MGKKVKVRWAGKMSFIGIDEQNHSVLMDAGEKGGGDESAFKPVDLLLAALGGCTGIDVVNILKKQKQDVREFWIEIDGVQAEDHPRYFTEIKLEFVVRGENINKDILKRSDIIFVMEKFHKDVIINMMPEIKDKVRLLKEGADILDPIGKSVEEYKNVLGVIKQEVENIFLEIFKEEKNR